MKITLTAKLKLLTTPEQCAAWRATSLAYRDALNHVSAYSFVHGKTGNVHRLQQACPKCGFTSKANWKDAGLLLVCQNCHYTLHADLVGPGALAYERLSSGKTGWQRAHCQCALM